MDTVISNESVDDFDLNSIFMDGGVDPVGVEDSFECDKPHWRVSREDLRKVLQIIMSFPSRSTVFMAVWKEGANLHVHANNRDALVDVSLPIVNDSPADISKVYFLDTGKLLAFVNAYKQFVFSFDVVDKEASIFYESPYVRYKLDTIKVSLDEVKIPLKVNTKDDVWKKFPLSRNDIGVLKTLYGFAVKLSDSKVLIDSGKSEAFYTLYKFSVLGPTNVTEKVVVRRLDLSTIHEIACDDLAFAYDKERLYFKFALGIVSFVRVPYDEASFMYPDTFATGVEVGKFQLDTPLIKRALKLSILFNTEEVRFYSKDSDIFMDVSGKADFKVGSGQLGGSFNLSVDTFSKILGTIDDGEGILNMVVTEHGIDIALSRPVIYSLSRVSIGQIKRGLGTSTTSTATGASTLVKPSTTPVADFHDAEVFSNSPS